MRIEDSLFQYGSVFNTKPEASPAADSAKTEKVSFEELLRQEMTAKELTFSKHAKQRLEQREIDLSSTDLEKLNQAVKKAGEKGVGNTLVLMGQSAFVVNVTNHVVITAMSGDDLKENVFTQIDGAVII